MKSYEIATSADVRELYELQLHAFESEAEMIGSRSVPVLMETYEHSLADFGNWTVLVFWMKRTNSLLGFGAEARALAEKRASSLV